MNSFEVYQLCRSLSAHFTSSYDFFKYNGKVRADPEKFKNSKQFFAYKKLSSHIDPKGFILSNILENPKIYIFDLINSSDCDKIYKDWALRTESLSYIFSQEIKNLDDDLKSNFICEEKQLPKIVLLYFKKKISLETLTILLDITKSIKYIDKELDGNSIWQELSFKVKKYMPFLQYEKKKFVKIVKSQFNIT